MIRYYVENSAIKNYLEEKDMLSYVKIKDSKMIFEGPFLEYADQDTLSEAIYELIRFNESNGDYWDEEEYCPVDVDFDDEEYLELKDITDSSKIKWEYDDISYSEYKEDIISGYMIQGTEFRHYKFDEKSQKPELMYYAFSSGYEIDTSGMLYDQNDRYYERYSSSVIPDVVIENDSLVWVELSHEFCDDTDSMSDNKALSNNCLMLPNFCNTISVAIFENDPFFVNLELTKNIRKIAPYAFAGAESLEYVKIGKQMEYIGFGAFLGCINLKKIILPSHLDYSLDYLLGIGENNIDIPENNFFDMKELQTFIDDKESYSEYMENQMLNKPNAEITYED